MKVLNTLVVFIALAATVNSKENIVGKTSAIVTSSNYVSSSSNVNGKVNSASKLDSYVIKGSADIKGTDGVIEPIVPKVEGVRAETINISGGDSKDVSPQLNTRFDSFESNNEHSSSHSATTNGFVQIKDPANRRFGEEKHRPVGILANRFSQNTDNEVGSHSPNYSNNLPMKSSGISAAELSETRRILDEVLLLQLLSRLNHYRTRPELPPVTDLESLEALRKLDYPQWPSDWNHYQ